MTPVNRTNGADAVVSGCRPNLSVFSCNDNDKNLVLWCFARFSLCFRIDIFGLSISTGLGTGAILLFRCIWCTHASDACRKFLFGPQISVDGGHLVVGTWPSCDEQESHGMQVQRTLVLK